MSLLSVAYFGHKIPATVISAGTPGPFTFLFGQLKRNLGGNETQRMRKWQRLFVNCFEGKKLIFTKRELLNFCQDGTGTSWCSGKC